jgi:anti-sigma B factor antagonist
MADMPELEETGTDRLTLDIERQDGVAVVRCGGKLVLGVTGFLYDNVRKLIPECSRIVLDLTDLKDMDSMGIGTLVRLYVSAKSAGCTLELINLGKRIRDLLGVTHLLSVFAICGEQGVRLP